MAHVFSFELYNKNNLVRSNEIVFSVFVSPPIKYKDVLSGYVVSLFWSLRLLLSEKI